MNGNKDNFPTSLKKDLEKELEHLKKEKKEERERFQKEMREVIKKELVEAERKNAEKIKELEGKLKQFHYWLFGVTMVLLLIIGGVFFYLRNSFGK